MKFETLSSKITYHGKVFDVRQDHVGLPNGTTTQIDIVIHNGSVAILPLDGQGMLWFVRQYRHAAQGDLLEVPAGTLEVGEDPEMCARREIREEIGMSAGRVVKVGEFFLAPGYSTEYMYVYLATDLKPDPLQGDADEFLSVEKIPLDEAFQLAETGQLRDCKTYAALILARRRLS